MSYYVHVTRQTERDLDDAAEYIAFTLLNPDAAYQLLVSANKVLSSLDENLQRNRRVDDPILSAWGVRFVMIKNYLAFYVIEEERNTVHIIRFLYAKRNWVHILKQGISLE
ncbi:MAG: type II toxin-antitoxin system RelE/ParE family toxin [Lachnospiraceae bacterium]|nr:type II toxin-antitoxin system RelE/ParE family toxin [Lachnospiraceae bacterium]